jgi:hypothetical protein
MPLGVAGEERRHYQPPRTEAVGPTFGSPLVTSATVPVGPVETPPAPIATPVTSPDREER